MHARRASEGDRFRLGIAGEAEVADLDALPFQGRAEMSEVGREVPGIARGLDQAVHGAPADKQLDPEVRMEVEAESGALLGTEGDGGVRNPLDRDRRTGNRGSGRAPACDGSRTGIPPGGARHR